MKNLKKIFIFISVVFFLLLGKTFSFADEEIVPVEKTNQFKQWIQLSDEEKKNTIMPNPVNVIGKKVQDKKFISNFLDIMLQGFESNEKYSLSDNISIDIKDQQSTNECWAFVTTSAIENNVSLTTGKKSDSYSPRHIDYSCSKTFLDGVVKENHFEREVGVGGNYLLSFGYLSSGQGPILESDMRFKDDESKINISEIQNKTVQKQFEDGVIFSPIYKSSISGDLKYYADPYYLSPLSTQEVSNIRKQIKEHIVKYGGVCSYTYGGLYSEEDRSKLFYNNTNIFKATASYCDNENLLPNHAILIVGWDDNYDINNFSSTCRPKNKGAWKCLNSYGSDSFENGYIWISYDDVFIEQTCFGIKAMTDVDYDHIYQYDDLGCNSLYCVTNSMSQKELSTAYQGNVFSYKPKNPNKKEEISEVGIYLSDYTKVQIYVNPNGELKPINEMIEATDETEILDAGYHVIKLKKPITIEGDKFSVAVKYISGSEENIAYLPYEEKIGNTFWESATGNKGESYYSGYGVNWEDITYQYDVENLNETKYGNACIKVFTVDKNPISVTSNKYSVKNDKITQVPLSTTVENFKQNITVTGADYNICDANNRVVESGIMKTGYKLNVQDVYYPISVLYDFNGDGLFNTVEISKIKLHLSELPKYMMTGIYLESADVNNSSKVDLTDLSLIIDKYMKLP